jgi:3-oxoacyl-[acyl-carrier protein] reductase
VAHRSILADPWQVVAGATSHGKLPSDPDVRGDTVTETATDNPTGTPRRTAIVTGAARGIGAAVARRLAVDGMAVAVLDLDEAGCAATVDQIGRDGGTAIAVGADVSRADQVEAAVGRVSESLGAPTVLVNNAGIIRDNLLFKMSEDDWDAVMGVHLRGAFLMSRAAQAHMVEASWGRIVNLSSTSALGNRGQVNYSAAKAGMQGFTKTLAIELGRFGVTANAVAPGTIETDMTAATAKRIGIDFEDFKQAAAQQIPVGRVGQPEDIAHTVSFLVSEGAGFVSGQVIYVAGGPRD